MAKKNEGKVIYLNNQITKEYMASKGIESTTAVRKTTQKVVELKDRQPRKSKKATPKKTTYSGDYDGGNNAG